jgi:uncharacterized membrane protein YedE/YeeE
MTQYLPPLLGGILLGISSAMFMLFAGRILGISGIVGTFLDFPKGDTSWRLVFVLGLVAGGALFAVFQPAVFANKLTISTPVVIVSGLLVGFGTRLGNGCTSGHGICGNSRLSVRSFLATITFMATGAVATYIVQHIFKGAL